MLCLYVYRSDSTVHIYLVHAYSFLWQEGGGEEGICHLITILKQWKWEKWTTQWFLVEKFVDWKMLARFDAW